jgi:hypothetical protein
MAPKIGQLVRDVFYPRQELTPERGPPPDYYRLLPRPLDDEITWIDTGHSRLSPGESAVGTSYVNRREASAIVSLLKAIAASGQFLAAAKSDLKENEPLVGVICMYGPQSDLIEEMSLTSGLSEEFRSLIKIDTVDAYQGKENRIVFVSLVRNNPEYSGGFVRIPNRVNVALSRAMERLVIVGSADMFGRTGNCLSPVVRSLRRQHRLLGEPKRDR